MGQSTPIRQVPKDLATAVQELCLVAQRTGRVMDIAEDSARLLKAFPDSGLSEADIGEVLVRQCVEYHGVNVKLNGREA